MDKVGTGPSALGSAVPTRRCRCGCSQFAVVHARQANSRFATSEYLRCMDCKDLTRVSESAPSAVAPIANEGMDRPIGDYVPPDPNYEKRLRPTNTDRRMWTALALLVVVLTASFFGGLL
jgi:hypothetical protein